MIVMIEPISITYNNDELEKSVNEMVVAEHFRTTLNCTFPFIVIVAIIEDICKDIYGEFHSITENVQTGEYSFSTSIATPIFEPFEIDVDIEVYLKLAKPIPPEAVELMEQHTYRMMIELIKNRPRRKANKDDFRSEILGVKTDENGKKYLLLETKLYLNAQTLVGCYNLGNIYKVYDNSLYYSNGSFESYADKEKKTIIANAERLENILENISEDYSYKRNEYLGIDKFEDEYLKDNYLGEIFF